VQPPAANEWLQKCANTASLRDLFKTIVFTASPFCTINFFLRLFFFAKKSVKDLVAGKPFFRMTDGLELNLPLVF
jgi:hypothetical protein